MDKIIGILCIFAILVVGILFYKDHFKNQDEPTVSDIYVIEAEKCYRTNDELRSIIKEKDLIIEGLSYSKELLPAIFYLQPNLDPLIANAVEEAVLFASEEFNIPPKLILCIIWRESNFNPLIEGAELSNGERCRGLMQIRCSAHPDKIGQMEITNNEVFYIKNNVYLGTWIFSDYFDQLGGDIQDTLKKYVGGNHNGYVDDILQKYTELKILERQ